MFVVVCDRDWRVKRASTEFAEMVGRTQSELARVELDKLLEHGPDLASLADGGSGRVWLKSNRGPSVEVWVRALPLESGPEPERVLVGASLAGVGFELDSLPGWKSLDSIEAAVWTQDASGVVTFANARLLEMLGLDEPELVGRSWNVMVPPQERQWVGQQLQICMRGEHTQFETTFVNRGRSTIPVIVNARPATGTGRVGGCVLTCTDISDRKRAEQELRVNSTRLEQLNTQMGAQRQRLLELTDEMTRANDELQRLSEAKSDFVSAVSHDLRTPLTTIIEGIALVEDGTLGEVNDEQRKFLNLAREDAERLGDFINDILDLAKIEAGKVVLNRTRVDITDQVNRARRSYENYMREKGLTLAVELPGPYPPVFCDAGHYSRVLMNLLSNAIKFTNSGGTIKVRARTLPGGQVMTEVLDTGIGIPKEQQHVIFGKFEQVRTSGTYRRPGSGLGLSLCKQLVELNGGTIGFDSGQDKGSRFFFTLREYDELLDLESALAAVGERATSREVVTMVALLRLRKPPRVQAELDEILGRLAKELKPFAGTSDAIRTFPRRKGTVLVSARAETDVGPKLEEMVEHLQASGIAGVSIASFASPQTIVGAKKLLDVLEDQLQMIT